MTYDLKTDAFPEMKFENTSQIGFIAQEVEAIAPALVRTNKDGYKSVAYSRVVPFLVEAMKEQQQQIRSQEKELALVKSQLMEIKELLLLQAQSA